MTVDKKFCQNDILGALINGTKRAGIIPPPPNEKPWRELPKQLQRPFAGRSSSWPLIRLMLLPRNGSQGAFGPSIGGFAILNPAFVC